MKRILVLQTLLIIALFVFTSRDTIAQAPDGPPHTRILQSLCRTPNGFFGHYLSLDFATGELRMSRYCDLDHSESFWEVTKLERPSRREESHLNSPLGYRSHVIRQRGNNKYNGHYVTIDVATGEFRLTEKHEDAASWLVRYAGLYKGYHSYYLQTLAKTNDDYDFAYAGVDQETGKLVLFRKPVDETNWFLSNGQDLPTERIDLIKKY